MVSNSVSGEYWSHLCSNFSKTWAESLSLQHFTSQTHRDRSCCVTGTGQYLWVMEDHSHDWTPLRCLIAQRRVSVPAFPLCGLRSRSSCSFFQTCMCPKAAGADLTQTKRQALRKSTSVAAICIMAVKTQQATVLLPKVPPFATNCLNVVLLRR